MPDAGFPVEVIGSVPVVASPKTSISPTPPSCGRRFGKRQRGHGAFVVDMSRTQFCDTAGLHALVDAHKRARAEGGQVVGGDTVLRIFSITGLDRVIPYFSSLEQALAQTPAAYQDRE
jgi:anti-sigma B factor antagonist